MPSEIWIQVKFSQAGGAHSNCEAKEFGAKQVAIYLGEVPKPRMKQERKRGG